MTRKILPVYFFPGPEAGRKREHIKNLQTALAQEDRQEPEIHRIYLFDTDVAEVVSLLRNGSLFSSRRLVIIADAHALSAADIRVFKEYLVSPSPDAVLVFTTDEAPGTRDYPRSLADALPKASVEVFWEMFEKDKRSWVTGRFREKGLKADAAAVDLLLDVTEGTTDALREACDLLVFSVEKGGTITEKDVDRVLDHGREETVYSLFDRFCKRDLNGVLESYRKMIHSDPGTVDRILSLLADPISRLRDFSVLTNRGLPPDSAVRELQIRGGKRAVQAYTDGVRNFLNDELIRAVAGLIDLEAWLRTAPRELRAPKTELWFCSVIGRIS